MRAALGIAMRTAKHCCICIPGRACVERSLTCVRPPPPPGEHDSGAAEVHRCSEVSSIGLDRTSRCGSDVDAPITAPHRTASVGYHTEFWV